MIFIPIWKNFVEDLKKFGKILLKIGKNFVEEWKNFTDRLRKILGKNSLKNCKNVKKTSGKFSEKDLRTFW